MQKNSLPTIILTGGHAATPGIAVSEAIRDRYHGAKLFWIGSKYAVPGTRATTLEYKIMPEIGVNFKALIPAKLQTKFTRYTIPLLLNIPLSFLQAMWLLLAIRPQVIMSFGGFSSFPVIFWGWVFHVPVILHEQTVAAGRANLASAFFARKIALSRKESLKYFPRAKTVVTGNPLMKDVLAIQPKQSSSKQKNILVIGGSRGSEFINEEIIKVVPKLVKDHKIVHLTGDRDFQKYKAKEVKGYKVLAFIDPRTQRRELFQNADLIISRAGANTVSEVMYIKRPTIFIPLPRNFLDEQRKNAEYAREFGIAKVMLETEVTPRSLIDAIDDVFTNWEEMVYRVKDKESPDAHAAEKVADLILGYLK